MTSTVGRTPRLTKPGGFVIALLTLLLAGAVLAPSAYAHHPEITATVDCDGLVTFTSTAWTAPSGRGNGQIEIAYSVDNGPFVVLPADPSYRYDAANGYQFSGSFTPAVGWSTVRVRATARAAWDDGVAGGDFRVSDPITLPTDCVAPAAPAAVVADATCNDSGAAVTLTNTGGSPVDFTITAGALVRVVTVDGGGTTAVTVALPAGTPTTVVVTAEGMEPVSRVVDYECVTPTTVISTPSTAPSGGEAGGDAGSGAVTAPSGELPRTGAPLRSLAVLAVLAVLVGAVIVARARASTASQGT